MPLFFECNSKYTWYITIWRMIHCLWKQKQFQFYWMGVWFRTKVTAKWKLAFVVCCMWIAVRFCRTLCNVKVNCISNYWLRLLPLYSIYESSLVSQNCSCQIRKLYQIIHDYRTKAGVFPQCCHSFYCLSFIWSNFRIKAFAKYHWNAAHIFKLNWPKRESSFHIFDFYLITHTHTHRTLSYEC